MTKYENIIVFGCGGVGSWVAEYIARSKTANFISIVDFDVVEEKNLSRQNYQSDDCGRNKTAALRDRLMSLRTEDNRFDVLVYNRKVTEAIDLTSFAPTDLAIVATDNITSKRLIAGHFKRFLIVNCDKNFVEIKTFLDDTDRKAWDMGGGYSNAQDIVANLYAALLTSYIVDNELTDTKLHIKVPINQATDSIIASAMV